MHIVKIEIENSAFDVSIEADDACASDDMETVLNILRPEIMPFLKDKSYKMMNLGFDDYHSPLIINFDFEKANDAMLFRLAFA